MNFLESIMLMAPPEGQPSGGLFGQMFPFVVVALIFWFVLIRPGMKKQKAHNEMLQNIKNGDKIVTSGGIYGTVAGIDEDRVQLKVADGVKISIAKSAIAGLQE